MAAATVESRTVVTLPRGLLTSSLTDSQDDLMVSFCPTGRLFAYVSPTKAHFMATESDHPDIEKKQQQTQPLLYQNVFQGLLDVARDPMLPRPLATACAVIPVALLLNESPHLSSVIVIGFNDGSIAVYSKTGRRILMQHFHSDHVSRITAMTHSCASIRIISSNLIVMYRSGVVCIIDGVSLAELIEEKVYSMRSKDDTIEGTQSSLIYKKYNLEQQTNTLDIAMTAPSTLSHFDYMREASVVNGPDAIMRHGPSAEAKLIAVGEQPMIALYRINKDAGTINVSEVVQEVATRMTNAVLDKLSLASGWLGWGGRKVPSSPPAPSVPPEEKQQRTLNLKMSTNIPDMRRQVLSITLSPFGNLAALVDGFGRILLLDINSLVIRRMWKGYRGAQCSWLTVTDPAEEKRAAQCLCIYLPRGVLEFWPVQSGPRAGAFSVGKNCRLLYTSSFVFGKDEIIRQLPGPLTSFSSRALLLSPDGKLLTFTVPFPSLIKRSNPLSHDFHFLQKLNEAICTGNTEVFEVVSSTIKSSQAMQEVIQTAIQNYSSDKKSRSVYQSVLDIAVKRSVSSQTCTVPLELLKHFLSIQCLSQLYFTIEDISLSACEKESVPSSISQVLMKCCGLASVAADRIGELLTEYFQSYSLNSKSRQLSLMDFISCFSIFECDINCLLPEAVSDENCTISIRDISVKESLSESQLINVASFIFEPLLNSSTPAVILDSCPLAEQSLIHLLFKLCLSGSLWTDFNPGQLVQSLHSILCPLLKAVNSKDITEWITVLSCSHVTGHALIIAMLCQHFISTKGSIAEGEEYRKTSMDDDEWETVTVESEQWSRLCEYLELLTVLSLITGVNSLRTLPPVLYTTAVDDLNELEFSMFFQDEHHAVNVAALETSGPVLIAHCIARSLVERKISGRILTELRATNVSHTILLNHLQGLMRSLPHTLSLDNILLCCSYHAAFNWKENQDSSLLSLAIEYASCIQSPTVARGLCSFLWHALLEKEVFQLLESMRKSVVNRDTDNSQLLWASRSIVHCLEQLNTILEPDDDDITADSIPIECPSGVLFIPSLIKLFPLLDPCLLQIVLQLLLQAELILDCSATVSTFTYYATAVRPMLKKGIFLCYLKDDSVSKAVMQKRLKFVNGAVTVLIKNKKQTPVLPLASFTALEDMSQSLCHCNVKQFSDVVFSLTSLWGLKEMDVHCTWIANLIGAGLIDNSKQIYQCIHNKDEAALILIPVVGQIALFLMDNLDIMTQNYLMAQTSTGLMEWMRRHKSQFKFMCSLEVTAKELLVFVELLKPHSQKDSDIMKELFKFIALMSNK